jgi:hypothetical protein
VTASPAVGTSGISNPSWTRAGGQLLPGVFACPAGRARTRTRVPRASDGLSGRAGRSLRGWGRGPPLEGADTFAETSWRVVARTVGTERDHRGMTWTTAAEKTKRTESQALRVGRRMRSTSRAVAAPVGRRSTHALDEVAGRTACDRDGAALTPIRKQSWERLNLRLKCDRCRETD